VNSLCIAKELCSPLSISQSSINEMVIFVAFLVLYCIPGRYIVLQILSCIWMGGWLLKYCTVHVLIRGFIYHWTGGCLVDNPGHWFLNQ
jgi:hypothetical protein